LTWQPQFGICEVLGSTSKFKKLKTIDD
jgi:hypothetical protein